jgi:SAM-dependent methyltransferase
MPLDFSKRVEPADLPELMDEPCSYEDFRACLLDLEKVNRLSLGYRPTLAWLDAIAKPGEVLRVVDVGCGGGDMLRRVAAWARQRGTRVQLTGVDLNPYAARAAREFGSEEIEWITGDAFTLAQTEGIDVVISSLLTHHLPTEEIVRLLAWMERVAHRGWFVNDLCREAVPYYAFGVIAKAAGWHRFVQHDGPVSFRRSFREEDWQSMCAAARVGIVSMQRWTPARLCIGRVK